MSELPRALMYFWKIKCSLADTVCQAFGLVCGIRCSGMAPCGPLYSLRSVCHRQGLDTSRPFRIGEPMHYPPYSAGRIKSELLPLALPDFLRLNPFNYPAGCNRAISRR
jgi:hypothetical protein